MLYIQYNILYASALVIQLQLQLQWTVVHLWSNYNDDEGGDDNDTNNYASSDPITITMIRLSRISAAARAAAMLYQCTDCIT